MTIDKKFDSLGEELAAYLKNGVDIYSNTKLPVCGILMEFPYSENANGKPKQSDYKLDLPYEKLVKPLKKYE